MPSIDEITILCYVPFVESYIAMLGEDCYCTMRHFPRLTWQERKTGQVHRPYAEHPDLLWMLERGGEIPGFVTFYLFPGQSYGHIDNNGVQPKHRGQERGTFMYQQVLEYSRSQGLRYAHVDTGLYAALIPARRA